MEIIVLFVSMEMIYDSASVITKLPFSIVFGVFDLKNK